MVFACQTQQIVRDFVEFNDDGYYTYNQYLSVILMFLAFRPSAANIRNFIESASRSDLSYQGQGATATNAPAGFNIDHNRLMIGNGNDVFAAAKDAIRAWKMFDTGWTTIYPENAEIETGQTVAILVRIFGIWSLNAARIVYTLDESGPKSRFGFAYGTLADHAEIGEERFSVEFDGETGDVWYDLFAFSRPGHPLARLGYPFSRMLQRRFAADSLSAMARAVSVLK